MPGFGQGPFGSEPFGEWKWSKKVLFDYIPELYRQQDLQAGGLLEAWTDSQRPTFDFLRRAIRQFGDLRDPLIARTSYDEIVTLRLGKQILPDPPIEQQGTDGTIIAGRVFRANTVRFTQADRGKKITIKGSAVVGNNRDAVIAVVLSPTQVLTDPPFLVDAGPLRWSIRPVGVAAADSILVEVRSGDVSPITTGWTVSDGYAAFQFQIIARKQFKEVSSEFALLTEREGKDGSITSGQFTSASANFTQQDVGKLLVPQIAPVPVNIRRFEILSVVDSTTVVLENSPPTTTGPLHWALLPFATLELAGSALPRGLIEQEGVDLVITNATTVVSVGAGFTNADIGKALTIRGSATPSNNAAFVVVSIIDLTSVTVAGTLTVDAGPLTWFLRNPSGNADPSTITVNAPSLLANLATDFGIEVDNQETEARQRRWVSSVSKWIDKKGTKKSYEILANISGFNVDVEQLYKISVEEVSLVDPLRLIEVGDASPGKSGVDGSLTTLGLTSEFSAPSASFSATDVGRSVVIKNSGSSNDGRFTIDTFINSTAVRIRPEDAATTPDVNNGTLIWTLVDLYTTQAPLRPRFDDFNIDYLVDLGATVLLDDLCPDDGMDEIRVGVGGVGTVTVVSSTPSTDQLFPVVIIVSATGDLGVVTALGLWKLIDSASSEFFLETVPVDDGFGNFTFQVVGAAVPATGAASLVYICELVLGCGFCASSTVLATITPGDISDDSGVALERDQERLLRRLEDTTPIHVRLVPRFTFDLLATLHLTASVDTGEVGASLLASMNPSFDDFPADDFELDKYLTATISTGETTGVEGGPIILLL